MENKALNYTALAIGIIGAINWGLIGFFNFNLVPARRRLLVGALRDCIF